MSERPEWLKVGAEVASVRSDWRSHPHRPKFARIARIGKRDVVLDDDERFNVNHLSRRDGGSWGWTTALLPADSPVVAMALGRWERAQQRSRVLMACDDFRMDKATAAELILACAPLTGIEDEIRALFGESERPGRDVRPSETDQQEDE